jgi:hypothetical protein
VVDDDPEAVRSWLDKLAIQEVIVRYSDAATRGDWDAFAALWVDDAVWEVGPPVDTQVVGVAAIVETVVASVDAEDFLVQMTHGSVVTLRGDGRASATTTIHALARRTGEHQIVNLGVYYDDLVRVDGGWKFTKRMLQPVYSDTSPLPGTAPITRADLARLPSRDRN